MARATSARRFAQAAFEVALAREGLDRWEKDLADVQVLLSNEDFAALLDAPQVPADVKLDGAGRLLRDVSPRVRNFVAVLITRGRTRQFAAIFEEFRRLADEQRGTARAEVVTAVPLDDERRGRVAQGLEAIVGKKVVLTERVDPAILGGVVARVGDRLIDGSARTRLRDLRGALATRPL
jgi:F-type H+-transporting ATPase subunit delta